MAVALVIALVLKKVDFMEESPTDKPNIKDVDKTSTAGDCVYSSVIVSLEW